MKDEVILLAGAGDYYRLRWVNRKWAADDVGEKEYLPGNLQNYKNPWWSDKDVDVDDNNNNKSNSEDIDDWTQVKEVDMYGSPLDARVRQDRLNSEQRIAETLHDKFTAALRTPASNDRAEPLFKDAELDVIYRNHTGARLPFFETRRTKAFFNQPGKWSGVLRLGSQISDEYMDRVKHFIKQHETAEQKRREKEIFGSEHSLARFPKAPQPEISETRLITRSSSVSSTAT
ncbi:hypothetical protein C8R45DRAFT_1099298 [Mycena sanguinolenta]|nr:hypothetical protein C8R45DRAFT_1099298 [Mycena sanguinolenta]